MSRQKNRSGHEAARTVLLLTAEGILRLFTRVGRGVVMGVLMLLLMIRVIVLMVVLMVVTVFMMLVVMSVIMAVIVPVTVSMISVMMMVIVFMVMMMVAMAVCQLLMVHLPFVHIRIRFSYYDPQHVRLIRQVTGTCAVADRVDDHRRQAACELVHQAGYDSGARRCRHLQGIRSRHNRQSAHHLERRRSRHRINAMIAMDRSRAERYRGGVNFLDA